MDMIADGHGGFRDPRDAPAIVAATMVSTDLERARRFYEGFLGFECVSHAPGKLLVRDSHARELMQRGERGGLVIEVEEVAEIANPQMMHHHFGFDAFSTEDVDRMYAIASEDPEKYGIKKANRVTRMHGSYAFYFIDMDDNWWEIEYRLHGRSNEMVIAQGDYVRQAKSEANA